MRRCARACSVADDVQLSIALAETQFANGGYHDAQRTLDAAIARNRQAGRAYPRLVAALYEASGTVNLHRGDLDAQRLAMIGQSRTLRNLTEEDPQLQALDIEQGDYHARRGDWRGADRRWAAAQRRYAGQQQPRLATLAALRRAHAAFARGNLRLTRSRLREVASMPRTDDPAVERLRAGLEARLAAASDTRNARTAAPAGLRTDPASPPLVLYETSAEPSAEQAATQASAGFLRPDPIAAGSGQVTAI